MKKGIRVLLCLVVVFAVALCVLTACNQTTIQSVKFKLLFDVDGETYYVIDTQGTEVLEMPTNPTKTDYVFEGWYWDKDTWTRPFTANSLLNEALTSDMRVYAKWKRDCDHNAVTDKGYTATCTKDGLTDGSHCSKCNDVLVAQEVIKATGHSIEQAKAQAPTCTEVGWNAYEYCTTCDYTTKVELKANGHTIRQAVAKAPTCTEVGWNAYEYCANCDYTTKVEIRANGHTEGDWKIDVVPNCLSNGHMHKECDVCHLVLKEEDTNALGHDIKTVTAKAPTCTEVGWNAYDYCARCDYTTKVELSATGHSFKKDWVNDSICHWHESDCGHDVTTEPVLHDYDDNWKCTVCDYQDTAIHGTELRARTFSVDGTNLYTKVSNSTTTFSFINEIRVAKDASFAVYKDIQGSSEIITKTTALEIGDNVVYLVVRNGNDIGFYTATIRRRPIYNVTFDTAGGSAVANQRIEEDGYVVEPTTTRKGYTFDAWDYDLANPIIGDTAITASWDINHYNISYEMSDTGFAYRALNNSFNPTTYTVEDSITFSNPTCTGYTFNGWDIPKIAKGTVGDITVTAKPWSIVYYKITYNNNVASTSASKTVTNSNPTTYTVEDAITFVPASRSGYDFVAWDKSIEKGTTGAITVNASWSIVTYSLEYDLNDSEHFYSTNYDNSNPASYTIEDSVTFSKPTSTGYTFNGWDIPSIAKGTVGDKKLTALWTIINYSINYNYNIASDSASKTVVNSNPTTYTVEDAVTFISASRSGYDFVSWDRNIEKGTTGAITVNATWSIVTYSIEYDLNDSEHFYSSSNNALNPTTYTVEDRVVFERPTNKGYDFMAWTIGTIAKGSVGDKQTSALWSAIRYKINFEYNIADDSASKTVQNSNPATYTVEDTITFAPATRNGYNFGTWDKNIARGTVDDITISASWSVINYAITYDLSDTTLAYEAVNNELNPTTYTVEDRVSFSVPTCTGYTFNGWNTSTIAKGTVGEKNIVARWTAINYNINYEYNIAESSASKNVQNSNPTTYTVEDAITFTSASRSGYDFVAWDRTNIIRGSLGDITVNASWDIITYTLEYDVNDSELVYSASYDDSSNPATYTVEDSVTFSRPTCDGYTFNGWDTPAIAKGTVGDKKLTALWTAISYTINYNYNIADDSKSKTVENSNPTDYTVEDAITFAPATRNGYDFSAWDRTDIEIGTMGDITVNASWERNTYNVTYILNGGENAEANITTYTVEDGTITFSDATGENLFCGWYEDNADGEYSGQISSTIAKDITLYALFDGTSGLAISYGTVTGYTGNSNAVTIPAKYKGFAVQAVGDYAFDGCSGITSISFPEQCDIQVDADRLVDIQNDSKYPFAYENGVLKSTNKADSSKSTYKITALQPTTISFKYRVSSESNFDYLTIYKNTKQLAKISGDTSYVDYSVDLQIGDYLAFEYSKDSSTSKNDDCGYIQIESTLFGTVPKIGAYAFRGCAGLEDIIIPDYITAIGESAFSGCNGLTRITVAQGNSKYHSENNCLIETASKTLILGCQNSIIPTGGSVTIIGSSAFAGCIGLTSITIPDSIVSMGESAFFGCSRLTTVNWNATACETAGSSSNPIFANCSNLTALNIGDSVTSIPSYAFQGCSGLTSVVIPDNVNNVGLGAFSGCSGLTDITIPFVGESRKTANDTYQYPLGYIFGESSYTGGTATKQYYYGESLSTTTNTTYYIPTTLENVTVTGEVILSRAFYNCSNLASVTLGDNVTSIGSYALRGCDGLANITVLSGNTKYHSANNCVIETASQTLILGCKTSIIPTNGSVTSIGSYAFSYCKGLTNVTIPDSVTSIEDGAFVYCSGLTNIVVSSGNTKYYSANNCVVETASKILILGCKTSIIPADGSVTSIGSYSFRGCSELTSITIPNSVTSIGYAAFFGCGGLEEITIPFVGGSKKTANDTYQYPFGYIFGTGSYTGGTVTEQHYRGSSASTSVSTISKYCIPTSLKKVTVTGGNILYGAFYNCANLTNVTIGESVTSIGESAFFNCSGLTSITIPNKVTSIGRAAFSGCSGLTEMTIPFVGDIKKTSSSTNQYPFGYIFGTSDYDGGIATKQSYYGDSTSSTTSAIYYIPSLLKTVTITGGNILYGAFSNCAKLTSVTIGESVTSIGSSAFSGCSGLTEITIPFVGVSKNATSASSSTLFGYIFGGSKYEGGTETRQFYAYSASGYVDYSTYYIPSSLKKVTVTGGNMLYGAFYNCSNIRSVIIGDGVTGSIARDAFFLCTGLTSVTIGGSVTSIGRDAFSGCRGLTSVTIGGSVTSIGYQAFYGCSGLTNIIIPDSVTSISDSAFRGCSSLTSIKFNDTSGWYRTKSSSDWSNKTNGYSMSVTNTSTNATYFTDTYVDYYWYKK